MPSSSRHRRLHTVHVTRSLLCLSVCACVPSAQVNAAAIAMQGACSISLPGSSTSEAAVLALFGSLAAKAFEPQAVRELLDRWADEATEGVRWQGRAELRASLPFLDDLSSSCVLAGEGTMLKDVLPDASNREFWICASSPAWLETGDDPVLSAEFETCEPCEEISEFYGQPVFVCTRESARSSSGREDRK